MFIWLGFWLALAVATHVPPPGDLTFGVRHGDKVLHFTAYFLLVLLGGRWLRARRGTPHGRTLVRWGAVYTAYAVLDEWLQQFVGRSMTLGDFLADAVGIVLGTLLLMYAPDRKRLSEPPGKEADPPVTDR